MPDTFYLRGEQDTLNLGRKVAPLLQRGDVVLLCGELGAGKTCFVRGVASCFGAEGSVTSPTFALLNIYETDMPLYHFDLYRMRDAAEVLDAGFDEYFFGDGVCLIEWPQAALPLLEGTNPIRIAFVYEGEGRRATVEGRLEGML